MKKVGRNEACHCGSGKKYKNCHQQIDAENGGKNKILLIGGVIAFFIIVSAILLFLNAESTGNTAPARAPAGTAAPGKAPAGEAPAGKVWSEEHGHWHDA